MYDVLIIGGGYTGAALAVRLSREAQRSLNIGVIEPREEVGRGVAYSAAHPDHRLNGPDMVHIALPDDVEHFTRWLQEEDMPALDPEAVFNNGPLFARRADFGRYMAALFDNHRQKNASGSVLEHIRKTATGLTVEPDSATVVLEDGRRLSAQQVVLATSNEVPAIPSLFRTAFKDDPAFLPNPWDLDRLKAVAADATVLILGTGLTAADVIATLAEQGHEMGIDAVSRRGLLPVRQNPMPDTEPMWNRFVRTPPRFVEKHGRLTSVLEIFRSLREDAAEQESTGGTWHNAFDELRDAARTLWPDLSLEEQNRFQRHLKPWYETRRFRLAPQISDILEAQQQTGRLNIYAGRFMSAMNEGNTISVSIRHRTSGEETKKSYDAVINCTGPSADPSASGNPVMMQVVKEGLAAPNPNGQGFLVDELCRAVSSGGKSQDRLRILGPLTRGCFVESGSVPAISYYIYKIMPDFLAALDAA